MQRSIELTHHGLTLRGMAHIPDGATEPLPAVVMYHGFTATRIEPHRLFVKIGRALESVGMASFRFDFSGNGESDGDFEDVTISGEIAEAHAMLDYVLADVLADVNVDPARVTLVGMSMGGLVASQVAGDRPDDVQRLVLLGPAGGSVYEVVSSLLTESGADLTVDMPYYDYLGNRVSRTLLQDLAAFRVYDRAKTYRGPVLILHGQQDEVVPSATASEYQEMAYGGRANVRLLPEANHTFDSSVWEAEVIQSIVDFVGPAGRHMPRESV
ncbi:alpha/beta hydrolase family protein [Alicyclobacillus sp. ALC3]|uniref:alpha/beta hydrolase family protein n=1 Tax=Alicyclobacillus sp. ALC3 TaxID=2796143 RepID=UPI002378F219|nr:alpha/beta hydrolase [Alicyclobacillus sp. ALC3]WDL99081.1 alpha/beta hydrolase [Alicyclobacillus sp. ALC3]